MIVPDCLEEVIISEQNSQGGYPIDHKLLDVMRTSMGAIFNELLATYMEQSNAFLAEIEKAFDDHDNQVVERIFHSMGSSSLNVGARKLSELARVLEMKASENPDQITRDHIQELKKEYLVAEEALKKILLSEPE